MVHQIAPLFAGLRVTYQLLDADRRQVGEGQPQEGQSLVDCLLAELDNRPTTAFFALTLMSHRSAAGGVDG